MPGPVRRLRSLARSTVLLHSVAWGDGLFPPTHWFVLVVFHFLLFFIQQHTSPTCLWSHRGDKIETRTLGSSLPGTENVDGTRWPTSGWSLSVSQMTEDLVPSGLGSVSFLPRQARLCQFIRLGRGSLCTPLFGILWFSTARTQQPYLCTTSSLPFLLLVWPALGRRRDTADSIVLVWEVVGASSVDPLAVLRDPEWNRLSSCFR